MHCTQWTGPFRSAQINLGSDTNRSDVKYLFSECCSEYWTGSVRLHALYPGDALYTVLVLSRLMYCEPEESILSSKADIEEPPPQFLILAWKMKKRLNRG